ncbi:hypothetical protein [Clostridium botulinum]|uniref:hypothetical protein n=1 Tax=Clostridium botulinum TaxID=1491 RepID=UPI001E3E57FC|nr:hypothetical protein [Clostridium botulinum]MCD3252386.1 hypothetical protein [Clostridium botulinum C/D]MCD3277950.1 hypothetical protein [Clostridium botulinum C/D]MCD3281535.1 hypothetical protein [Clostridium botulinum C/D]MCD3355876.1 hypothetical protein [Clostridium botulinum C/D]
MFLYILNMNKENMIKIGIATGVERIKQHLRTYEELIDLDGSFIITAKDDNTIRILEKQLLEDYCEFEIISNKFKGLDGSTELRKIEILDNLLDDIQYKSNKFPYKNIQIKKGIVISINKHKHLQKVKRRTSKLISIEKHENDKIIITEFINNLINDKNNINSFTILTPSIGSAEKIQIIFNEDCDWWIPIEKLTSSYNRNNSECICIINFRVRYFKDKKRLILYFNIKNLEQTSELTLEKDIKTLYENIIKITKECNIQVDSQIVDLYDWNIL